MGLTANSACVWCFFGQMIGRVLKEDAALRRFNIAMAAALLLSLAPIFMGNYTFFVAAADCWTETTKALFSPPF